MNTFNADAVVAKVKEDIVSQIKTIAQDAFKSIVEFSPAPGHAGDYSKGSYVLSHRVALDTADTSTTEVTVEDPAAFVEAAVYGHEKIDELVKEPAVSIVISNSIDHAINVETGTGWRRTPGYQVYEKTFELMKDSV